MLLARAVLGPFGPYIELRIYLLITYEITVEEVKGPKRRTIA